MTDSAFIDSDATFEDLRARLTALVEQIPAGVIVADHTARIVLANREAEHVLGHPIFDVADLEGYADFLGYTPDGRRLAAAEYPLPRALRGETLEEEYRYDHRASGTRVWIRARAGAIRNDGGGIVGAIVLFWNIDAEKASAEALRGMEVRLEMALSAGGLGAWHLDTVTGALTCTASCKANFGRGPTDQFGYGDLLAAIEAEDRPGMEAAVRRAVETGNDYLAEYRVRWPDGSLHWIIARGSVTRGPDGAPVAMDGVTADITARRRLEQTLRDQAEELRLADRRKDQFLAQLSHELRNPLAAAHGALQMLRLRTGDPGAIERAAGVLQRQLEQISRLVDDLLEVARIAEGKLQFDLRTIDLAALMRDTAEAARPRLADRRQSLRVECPSPVMVRGDELRLTQVFANLLTNASKYTPSGGHVCVSVETVDGQAVAHVRDDGIGIPEEMLTKIFDLFVQVDAHRDHQQGGMGLGLTLVERLVRAHGGTVGVHSEGAGKGSEFVVRLPLVGNA